MSEADLRNRIRSILQERIDTEYGGDMDGMYDMNGMYPMGGKLPMKRRRGGSAKSKKAAAKNPWLKFMEELRIEYPNANQADLAKLGSELYREEGRGLVHGGKRKRRKGGVIVGGLKRAPSTLKGRIGNKRGQGALVGGRKTPQANLKNYINRYMREYGEDSALQVIENIL